LGTGRNINVTAPSVPGRYRLSVTIRDGSNSAIRTENYTVYVTHGSIQTPAANVNNGVNVHWLEEAFRTNPNLEISVVSNLNVAISRMMGAYIYGADLGDRHTPLNNGIRTARMMGNCNDTTVLLQVLAGAVGIRGVSAANILSSQLGISAIMMDPNQRSFGSVPYMNGVNTRRTTGVGSYRFGSETGAWIFTNHVVARFGNTFYDPTLGLRAGASARDPVTPIYPFCMLVFARLTRVAGGSSFRYRVQIRDGTVAEITSTAIPGRLDSGMAWPEIRYSLVVPQNISALGEGGTISILLPSPIQDSTLRDGFSSDHDHNNVSTWEAVSAVDWINIEDSSFVAQSGCSAYDNPANIDYSNVLEISVDPTHIGSMRTGEIVVSNGGIEYVILIHQDGDETSIEVEDMAMPINAGSGEYAITIKSNSSWAGLHGVDWIYLPYPSGIGNGELKVVLADNDTGGERTATITILGGGVSKTITVMQSSAGNVEINS